MAKENTDFISREGTIIKIEAERDISREKNRSSLIRNFTIQTSRFFTDKDNVSHEVKDFLTFETKNKSLFSLAERNVGDIVRVSFTIGGKKWKDSYFNKLSCTSITLLQPVAAPTGYQQPQNYAPPQPQYQQPQGYVPAQPQYQQAAPQPQYQQPTSQPYQMPDDDLPF